MSPWMLEVSLDQLLAQRRSEARLERGWRSSVGLRWGSPHALWRALTLLRRRWFRALRLEAQHG